MPRLRHDPTKNLVGFLVGDVAYAVRIEAVREIVNPLDVVELPRAPTAVKGVASFRGEVVPVIDLRVRFALAPSSSRKNKWIIIDVSARPKVIAHEPAPAPTRPMKVLGAWPLKSSRVVGCRATICLAVTAVIAIGTSCSFSSVLRAVTTTSSTRTPRVAVSATVAAAA